MSVNSAPERSGDLNISVKFIRILEKNIIPVLFFGAQSSAHPCAAGGCLQHRDCAWQVWGPRACLCPLLLGTGAAKTFLE